MHFGILTEFRIPSAYIKCGYLWNSCQNQYQNNYSTIFTLSSLSRLLFPVLHHRTDLCDHQLKPWVLSLFKLYRGLVFLCLVIPKNNVYLIES